MKDSNAARERSGKPAHDSAQGPNRWMPHLAIAALVLLAAGFIAHEVSAARMRTELLRADPAAIDGNPTLVRFAASIAAPAYTRHCASCHGADLRGDSIGGAPNLRDQDWLYGSGTTSEIERVIYYGIRSNNPKAWNLATMPGFALPIPSAKYKVEPLKPGEIDDLVQFLQLQGGRAADHAAAMRGEALYAGKGECFDCHSSDAHGDPAIGAPNLTDAIWLYGDGSPQSIRDSIAHGHAGVCPAWIGKLTPAQIRALAVYIHIQSQPTGTPPAHTAN